MLLRLVCGLVISGLVAPLMEARLAGAAAGYYGYLWSEVFSADMFTIFKTSGDLFSPIVGKRYRGIVLLLLHDHHHRLRLLVHFLSRPSTRNLQTGLTDLVLGVCVECILEPGGTKDGMLMVTDFLARELDPDAFLISCGLLPDKRARRGGLGLGGARDRGVAGGRRE